MTSQSTKYKRSIDQSGRLPIAKFRQSGLAIATSQTIGDYTNRYLCVCPLNELEILLERRIRCSDRPSRMTRFLYGSNFSGCDYDEEGRIKIPNYLRRFINIPTKTIQLPLPLDEFSDLVQNRVVICEVYSGIKLFEIWNRRDWEIRRKLIASYIQDFLKNKYG